MSVLIRNRKEEDFEVHRGEGHVTTEAEVVDIGVMHLKTKGCLGLPAPTRSKRGAWNGFPFRSLRRNQPCQCLNFKFLTTRTVR